MRKNNQSLTDFRYKDVYADARVKAYSLDLIDKKRRFVMKGHRRWGVYGVYLNLRGKYVDDRLFNIQWWDFSLLLEKYPNAVSYTFSGLTAPAVILDLPGGRAVLKPKLTRSIKNNGFLIGFKNSVCSITEFQKIQKITPSMKGLLTSY